MMAAHGAAAAGAAGGAAGRAAGGQLAGQQRLAKYQVELRPVHVSTMVVACGAEAGVASFEAPQKAAEGATGVDGRCDSRGDKAQVKRGGARWGEVPEVGADGSFGGGAVTICAAPTSCAPRGWLSHRRALHVSPVSGPLSSVPGLTSLTQACGGSPSLASAASEWPSRTYHASPPSLSLTTETLPESLSSPPLHLTSALPHLQ
ncbi:unnamed protein product [Closterium sp. Naga37s-1]|nr:unnamed protein product [Closterium sp. Naga37s-1]